jgi:hypothetical protein
MYSKTLLKDILTVIGLSIALTIFITHPGFSQDTTKINSDKKVKITAKIIQDNNGKKQEFDTTINLDRDLKPGEEQELMKSFQMKFKDLGDQMKNLQVEISNMDIPDSGMMDSVQRMVEKEIVLSGSGNGKMHFRNHYGPRAYNYDYHLDFPELPEPPQPLIEEFNDENVPHIREHSFTHRSNGQTLNDILGDIPMDRVKSYSIKDTKDGKKIEIELKNGPVVENHNKVIIIHTPRPEGRHGEGPDHRIKKRVIIRDGDQEEEL